MSNFIISELLELEENSDDDYLLNSDEDEGTLLLLQIKEKKFLVFKIILKML